MRTRFIQPHLGLGDAIICNGMVRSLAQRVRIIWPAKKHNFESVREMWKDLEQVKVISVKDDQEASEIAKEFSLVIKLGLHSGQPLRPDWDRQMYEQARVDFEERWKGFKLEVFSPYGSSTDLPFVHQDEKRNFKMKEELLPNDWYVPIRGYGTIWEHLKALRTAPEIHVIDSCFLCLADSVPTKAKRLVLHAYATAKAKPAGPPILKKNWEILK